MVLHDNSAFKSTYSGYCLFLKFLTRTIEVHLGIVSKWLKWLGLSERPIFLMSPSIVFLCLSLFNSMELVWCMILDYDTYRYECVHPYLSQFSTLMLWKIYQRLEHGAFSKSLLPWLWNATNFPANLWHKGLPMPHFVGWRWGKTLSNCDMGWIASLLGHNFKIWQNSS